MKKKSTLLFLALIATSIMIAQTAPVLHFKFTNNLNDSSSNYFPTTAIGNVSYADSRSSEINGALVSTSGAVKLNANTGAYKVNFPFTFATWVKVNNLNTVNPLFTSEDDQASYSGIWVQILSDGTVAANVGNGGTPNVNGRKSAVTNSPVITQMGAWYQIVVIATSISNFTIYVNGVLAPSTLSGNANSLVYLNANANNVAKAGSYTKGSVNTYFFDGVIDEMALWSSEITGLELSYILQEGSTNYTGIEKMSNNSFSIYPNPASENVSVVLPSSFNTGNTSVKIYDVLGALVKEEVIASSQNTFSIADLSAGSYIIQLKNNSVVSNTSLQIK